MWMEQVHAAKGIWKGLICLTHSFVDTQNAMGL